MTVFERLPIEQDLHIKELGQEAYLLSVNGHSRAEFLQTRIALEFEQVWQPVKKVAELANSCLNANDVVLGAQSYLLFACPQHVLEALRLFDAAFAKGISLFVTLMRSDEAPERFTKFWTEQAIAKESTLDRWKFRKFEQKLLHDARFVKIWKTSFEAFQEKDLTHSVVHLHFDGWQDQCAIPDEELFLKFLDEINNEHKSGPIAVNCFGGVGRSGTTALSHYLINHIRSANTVNIPELVLACRNQRRNFLTVPAQLSGVYSAVSVLADIRLKGATSASRPILHKNTDCLTIRLKELEKADQQGYKEIIDALILSPVPRFSQSFADTVVSCFSNKYVLLEWPEHKEIDTAMAQLSLKVDDDEFTVLAPDFDKTLDLFDALLRHHVTEFITVSRFPTDLMCASGNLGKTKGGWEITKHTETVYIVSKNSDIRSIKQLHFLGWDENKPVDTTLFHEMLDSTQYNSFAVISTSKKDAAVIAISHALHGAMNARDAQKKTLSQLETLLFNCLLNFRDQASFIPDAKSLAKIYHLFFAYVANLSSRLT